MLIKPICDGNICVYLILFISHMLYEGLIFALWFIESMFLKYCIIRLIVVRLKSENNFEQ